MKKLLLAGMVAASVLVGDIFAYDRHVAGAALKGFMNIMGCTQVAPNPKYRYKPKVFLFAQTFTAEKWKTLFSDKVLFDKEMADTFKCPDHKLDDIPVEYRAALEEYCIFFAKDSGNVPDDSGY